MIKPQTDVANRRSLIDFRAGVTPTITQQITVTRHDHGLSGSVSDTGQSLGAHGLPILIKANRRFDSTLAVAVHVNGIAGDMTIQSVEGLTTNLTAVTQIEVGLIFLDISETLIPLRLLNTTKLFTLNLSDTHVSVIGKHLTRR